MIHDFNYFISKKNTLEDLLNESFDNITTIELIKRISLLSLEERKKAFENEDIKNKLRDGILNDAKEMKDQYRYYREVMKYLNPEEVLSLYDSYYLRKFFSNSSSGYEYIFFVCLCEKDLNKTVRYVLNDDKMFYEFFKNNDYFYSMFYNLEFDVLKKVIFKMESSSDTYSFDFISSCSEEVQRNILNENIKDDTLVRMLGYIRSGVLSEFFKTSKRVNSILPRINILSYIRNGVVFGDKTVCSKEFFEKLKSSSFVEFRENINRVEEKHDPLVIERRLKEYYEELISSYNPLSKMFKEYDAIVRNPRIKFGYNNDFILSDDLVVNLRDVLSWNYDAFNQREVIKLLRETTNKKITEIVVDALFCDNYYNVCLNIKEMLRFNETLSEEEKVLDKSKIDFYKMILDFDNVSCDSKIEIYNNLKDKNYNLEFYEDLRKLKDLSYKKIRESIFKIKENSKCLDFILSKQHGVSVYDLREKKYMLLVRRMGKYFEDSPFERNCYSLISNENNDVYGNGYGFLYGFDSFSYDTVLHVLETDAFSMNSKDKSSNYVNRIMSPSEIVNSDNWYSEIQIVNRKNPNGKNKFSALKPSYLVVFDEIEQEVIEEAKRLSIPVVVISQQSLEKGNDTDIRLDRETDVYVRDYCDEITMKSRR